MLGQLPVLAGRFVKFSGRQLRESGHPHRPYHIACNNVGALFEEARCSLVTADLTGDKLGQVR